MSFSVKDTFLASKNISKSLTILLPDYLVGFNLNPQDIESLYVLFIDSDHFDYIIYNAFNGNSIELYIKNPYRLKEDVVIAFVNEKYSYIYDTFGNIHQDLISRCDIYSITQTIMKSKDSVNNFIASWGNNHNYRLICEYKKGNK